jgi:metal-responsive CopG/Arc/MetJ family transcriptional regulator
MPNLEIILKTDDKTEDQSKTLVQIRMDADYLTMLDNLMNLTNEVDRSKMIRRLIKSAYVQNIAKKN